MALVAGMKRTKKGGPPLNPRRRSDIPSPDYDPHHGMGKHCGYTRTEKGIAIAGSYSDQIDEILDEENALRDVLRMQQEFAASTMKRLGKRRADWFERVADEYDLDPDAMLQYLRHTREIVLRKDEEETDHASVGRVEAGA